MLGGLILLGFFVILCVKKGEGFHLFFKKTPILLAGLCLFGFSHAFDIKPSAQFFFPADVTIAKDSKSVSSEQEWETEFVVEAGVEGLFSSEFVPMRSGFGLGFRTSQKDDGAEATPASLPLWGVLSFGRIDRDNFISPYLSLRGGYLVPLTGDEYWWNSPVNFFVNCGVGAVLPKGFTLEVSADYSSMKKSYPDESLEYRVSSLRVGVVFAMYIEITHSMTYKPQE